MAAFPRPAEALVAPRREVPPPPAIVEPVVSNANSDQAALLLACHKEDPGLAIMWSEVEVDDDLVDDELAMLEEETFEMIYIFGYDDEPSAHKAWRLLVDSDGTEVLPKEYAWQCKEPDETPGLLTACFLDGSEEKIPGMLVKTKRGSKRNLAATGDNVAKRPASAQPKPKAKPKPESESDLDEDIHEEGADEETQSDPDEALDGPDAFLGKHVVTNGLAAETFNDKLFTAIEVRDDGRILLDPLCPRIGQRKLWVCEDKIQVVTNDELVPKLREVIVLDGIDLTVKSVTQGSRPFIVTIKNPDGAQLGQVSQKSVGDDIGKAFKVACDTMFRIKGEGVGFDNYPRLKQRFATIRDSLAEERQL